MAVKIVKSNSQLGEQNLLGLAHKNIVNILDVLYKKNCKYGIVLMEYLAPSRELQSLLDDPTACHLSAKTVIKFALDICHGLEYCHKNAVLHMDLKPANILVFNDSCKLCDFGNSVRIGTGTEKASQPLLVSQDITRHCVKYSWMIQGVLFCYQHK